MSTLHTHTLDKKTLRNLPHAKMVYPASYAHRFKYAFWRVFGPLHPVTRDTLLSLRVIHHSGRQDHLLGVIAPHLSIEEFISYLISQGYGNHFFAWRDEGEIVSLRYVENFTHQYHLRIFHDREVRAHYEYTPECYPVRHMKKVDMQARREEFLRLLGDKIVPHH